MFALIATPANNERGPRYMEKALAAIHQSRVHRGSLTLAYGIAGDHVGLLLRCANAQREAVLGPVIANYPQCSIIELDERAETRTGRVWSLELALVPELFPILRHAQFEDALNRNFADPVSGLLRAIRPDGILDCRVEILCRPASHRRCHAATLAVRRLDRDFFRRHHVLARYYARHALRGWQRPIAWLLGLMAETSPRPHHSLLETSASRIHEREEEVQAAAFKVGGHLFEVQLRLVVSGPPDAGREATERLTRMAGALGAFTRSQLATFAEQSAGAGVSFLMSHEELATLWHPPTASTAAERFKTNDFTELEPPAQLATGPESVSLGRVAFRDDVRPVGLDLDDRRRHLYLVGKTGMGKSTLLLNMLVDDLQAKRGVCLVDPHGDLADAVAGLVPKARTNDVILFDAASRDYVVGFNPLACSDPHRVDQVTSGVVSAFKKLNDSWGPRLEDTLRNAVFAMVEQGGNLLSVMRLLGERAFREHAVPHIRDHVVRSFWMNEFASWSDHYRTEAVAAIQNKLRPFIVNSQIRAIVTQAGPSLDLRKIMDEGRVLIINLSKGRLGEDNSTLLGALLVTSIQQAAMTRADLPEAERRDFFLYVDEFQNFTTDSFAAVLSEARKFRLSLTVAHQYLSQLSETTANAVWGNVGSVIAFQVGGDDADILARQLGKFAGQVTPEQLAGLPKFTAYARLLTNGMPTAPFSLRTVPPRTLPDPVRREVIRDLCRRRFADTTALERHSGDRQLHRPSFREAYRTNTAV